MATSPPERERQGAEVLRARIAPAETLPEPEQAPHEEVLLSEYLAAVRERWLFVAVATLLAMTVTLVVTKFGMTKWYRAEAIIRPVTESAVQNRVAGIIGGLGGAVSLGGGLLGSQASNPASEYIPILESFDFTTELVHNHKLGDYGLPHPWIKWLAGKPSDPDWARFRELKKRFECEFSIRTGNLFLYYQDPSRIMARKILSYYISDLRERLRRREIQHASEAIEALNAQIKETSDNLLQAHLYELLARQLEQKKLAQVRADFAFEVLEAPTVPDKPYRPKIILDSVLAGMLTLMVVSLFVIARRKRT